MAHPVGLKESNDGKNGQERWIRWTLVEWLVLILDRLCTDQKTVWSVKCCLSDSIVSLDVETVGLIDLRMGW